MTEAIVTALITGGMSLTGVIITCLLTAKKSEKNAAVAQAVTDTKIQELTREVREHNGFAKRMPVVEQAILNMDREIRTLRSYHEHQD